MLVDDCSGTKTGCERRTKPPRPKGSLRHALLRSIPREFAGLYPLQYLPQIPFLLKNEPGKGEVHQRITGSHLFPIFEPERSAGRQ